MGKTYKDGGKPNRRNNVAMGMIMAGTGKSQVFQDKRNKRPKDARRQRDDYQRDDYGDEG